MGDIYPCFRSSSTVNMLSVYERRSVERDAVDLKSKRTASAQGLDRSNEGRVEHSEQWHTDTAVEMVFICFNQRCIGIGI